MADLQLTKATQSITKASSCRDDTKMLMQPHANWEEYLTPGPISIAILGELVFISSNVDFSINKSPPKDGFKFIKYPESFRACLMQVCNAGWGAFNVAHKNMDQIRLHTGNVPEYIKMSVKILLQDENELIETFLPDQLQNIENIANDCMELAVTTEKKFMDVIELIQELLEASTNAKSSYSRELAEVRQKLEIEKLKKKASEEANKSAAKAMEEMNQQLKDAQAAFKQSMDSLPSGWEAIGMDFVEGLAGSVNSMLSGLTFLSAGNLLNEAIKAGSAGPTNNGSTSASVSPTASIQENDPAALTSIYSTSSHMLSVSQSLSTFIEKEQIKCEKLRDKTSGSTTSDFQKKNFELLKQSLSKQKECQPQKEALSICDKGILICNDLEKCAEQGGCEDTKMKKLVSDIRDLIVAVQVFDSKAKANTNTPAFVAKPPQMSKTQASGSEKKSASQIATENARLKIEQNRAHMEQVRAAYEKRVNAMEEKKKELNEILITMRKCKVQEIDFDTTIKFLIKGLDAMGRVKEQWEKMVRFFQMVSNIIKTCLHTSLTSFTSSVQKASTMSYSPTMFIKDMIYTQAFHASNVASLVNMIAGTYTEVSNKHLMDRVSSLGKLMALDPKHPNFEKERQQLQNGCKEAEDSILQLVKTNKRNFEAQTRTRQAKIEGELKAVMPPPSPKETEKLQKIVKHGFNKKGEQDEENQFI